MTWQAMHTIHHMLEEAADEMLEDPAGTLADAFEACNIHLKLMACEPTIQVSHRPIGPNPPDGTPPSHLTPSEPALTHLTLR